MLKIGFIDYYLDEWHANNYPQWIKEASNGEMEVAYAYGLIDGEDGRRTSRQWCQDMGIAYCATAEELIEKSDRLIILSPDNCEMHEALCQLPLRSGKLTYIDKTFAPDYATAKRIFDLADKYNTPCYSTSALRFTKEYEGITDVTAINSWGPNGLETYSIHQMEPVMMLMKAEVARVMYQGTDDWYNLTVEFEGGKYATISGYAQGSPFVLNCNTKHGAVVAEAKSDFFHDFIVALVDFFRTGVVKVSHEETLSIMKLRTCAMEASKNPGTWVNA